MKQASVPAVYMRGGTSRAIIFHDRDLPKDQGVRDAIFLAALGSPDPYGRQLNGMGGGISSLSKIAVVGPPTHPEADVDYTFGQAAVDRPLMQYRGNCGNISSAIGPFAVDEGLVKPSGDRAEVRIHNTNTRKIIVARFAMDEGRAATEGDYVLEGVAGSGAPIKLVFLEPGGASTGKLLPTGARRETLSGEGLGAIEASLVDAANPVVFVAAEALGLSGHETPADLNTPALLAKFEAVRIAAAVRMGLVADAEAARTAMRNMPLVALLAPSLNTDADIVVRVISSGQPHKAVPLTGAMCLATAMKLDGAIAATIGKKASGEIRIAHPSGTITVDADVEDGASPFVREAAAYRTARRLMEGRVFVPASVLAPR